LSVVIDRARLPVISAERGESAHAAVSPKKRATRKSCAKGANVFAVRIWNIRFGITHCLPLIVDPTILRPTVLSSERAEVEVDSVDVYRCASV
jgi:hypothetical protein